MPAKPVSTPARVDRLGRSPEPARSRTSHSGIAATSRAATPEATPASSARVTAPEPAGQQQGRHEQGRSRLARETASARGPWRRATIAPSSTEAQTNRTPMLSSGGMVSTRKAIAR